MKILFFVFCTISRKTRLFQNSYFWLHGVLSVIIWNISKKASKKYIFKFMTTSFQISDILFIVFCIPSTAVDYALTSAWPFGDVWCRLSELSFLNNLNLFSQYFIFFRGRFFFLFVFFYLNLSFLLAGNQPWRLFFGQLVVIFVDNQERLSPRIRILLPGQFLIPATAFVSIYTLVLMALDRCVFSSEKHNLWLFKSLKRRSFQQKTKIYRFFLMALDGVLFNHRNTT